MRVDTRSSSSSSSPSFFSYLNPWKIPFHIYHVVSTAFIGIRHFFQHAAPRREDNGVVVLYDSGKKPIEEGGEIGEFTEGVGLEEYLSRATDAYPTKKVNLGDNKEVNIGVQWWSDIERTTNPDIFAIDGKPLTKAPKTDQEKIALLKELLQLAKGDITLVEHWTQVWNHRPKQALMERLRDSFREDHLDPIINQQLKKAIVKLDSKTGSLTCIVKGTIRGALAHEEMNSADFCSDNTREMKMKFTLTLTYDAEENTVTTHITFIPLGDSSDSDEE